MSREVPEGVCVSAKAEVRLWLKLVALFRPASATLVFLEDHHPIQGVDLGVHALDELEVAGVADVGDRAARVGGRLASEEVASREAIGGLHGNGGGGLRDVELAGS